MSEFVQALSLQSRVIHALILRETRTRFGRSRLGYFWAFFEPMAYLASLITIFSILGRTSPIGVDIKLFFLTGIIPWILFSKTVGSISNAAESNQNLLGYPQVKTLDIVLAKILLEFSTVFLVFLLYIFAFIFLFDMSVKIDSPVLVISILLLVSLLGGSLGLIGMVVKLYFSAYNNIQSIFLRFLFFTSGVFFTADSLPLQLQQWVFYNPIAHISEWIRDVFFKEFDSNFFSIKYPVLFALVTFLLSLIMERLTRYKLREF